MTQKTTNEEPEKDVSAIDSAAEEGIASYLEQHPDFFLRHPEVLEQLDLRHHAAKGTVSLIERQVQVLRDRNHTLDRQLRELVAIARENDVLAARLHRFALAMADSASLDDVFDNAYEMLRREFKLDAVAIIVQSQPNTAFPRSEFVGNDPRVRAVLRQFSRSAKPICGGKHDESMTKYLFGAQAPSVKSSALIPFGARGPNAVLCLGSHDPRRFHSGMGTVYLVQIADILMHSIARFS